MTSTNHRGFKTAFRYPAVGEALINLNKLQVDSVLHIMFEVHLQIEQRTSWSINVKYGTFAVLWCKM